VFTEIGRNANFPYGVFVTEFEELRSKYRSKSLQGGGVHGNAILSKFPFVGHEKEAPDEHFHEKYFLRGKTHDLQGFDWSSGIAGTFQLRKGGRAYVQAMIVTPIGPIVFSSVHLENMCVILPRMAQYNEVVKPTNYYFQVINK
jgi:hypothetical protein